MPRPGEFIREEAIEAAMNLFLAKGYEATPIEDLTTALGISRASLYKSFGDKHGLLIESLSRAERDGSELQSRALSAPGSARDVIRHFYQGLVESHLRRRRGRGCFFLTLGAELASGDADVRARVRRNLDRTRLLFLELLKRGQPSGELSPSLDTYRTAAALLGSMVGILTLSVCNPIVIFSK